MAFSYAVKSTSDRYESWYESKGYRYGNAAPFVGVFTYEYVFIFVLVVHWVIPPFL